MKQRTLLAVIGMLALSACQVAVKTDEAATAPTAPHPAIATAMQELDRHLAAGTIAPELAAAYKAGAAEGRLSVDSAQVTSLFLSLPEPLRHQLLEGGRVFSLETFGGNGRTCETCHALTTGTFTPEQARQRFAENPDDPLFRPIDSDEGDGKAYTRLLEHGTVQVTIPLPPGVKLADDPDATEVKLFRGTPTFINTAALDPVLMHDGRAPNLEDQALDAINVHAVPTRLPTREELEAVAFVQKGIFTDPALEAYWQGGPAPGLPEGTTDTEKRGRLFFVDHPVDLATGHGICAMCHSGPRLDEANAQIERFFPPLQFDPALPPTGLKRGIRFGFTAVAQENLPGHPVRKWLLQGPGDTWIPFESPDIGVALAHPLPESLPEDVRRSPPAFFREVFKTPSLRGIRHTPPYFHNNGAKTLEDSVAHYEHFLRTGFGFVQPQATVQLTEQDKTDIVAYLKLL